MYQFQKSIDFSRLAKVRFTMYSSVPVVNARLTTLRRPRVNDDSLILWSPGSQLELGNMRWILVSNKRCTKTFIRLNSLDRRSIVVVITHQARSPHVINASLSIFAYFCVSSAFLCSNYLFLGTSFDETRIGLSSRGPGRQQWALDAFTYAITSSKLRPA